VAKPLFFNGYPGKITEFVIVCKLYIRVRIREKMVEEQLNWILTYIQEESADV